MYTVSVYGGENKMSESTNNVRQRFIPENIIKGKRIMGMKPRNLIEGGIAALITALIIAIPPFVPKIRWILIICVGLYVAGLCILGIHAQAPTEFVKNYLSYRRYTKMFHYRRITNDPDYKKAISDEGKILTVRENKAKSLISHFLYGR